MLQPFGSGADLYFRKLDAPPGAGPLTDFRHVYQDGMVSDYASGDLSMDWTDLARIVGNADL
jgi:hypothetical protein